jgi:hypothetical protein
MFKNGQKRKRSNLDHSKGLMDGIILPNPLKLLKKTFHLFGEMVRVKNSVIITMG